MKLYQKFPLLLSILISSCVGLIFFGVMWQFEIKEAAVLAVQTQNSVTIGDMISVILSLPGITIPIIVSYVTFRSRDLQSDIVDLLNKSIEKLGFKSEQMSPALAHAASIKISPDRNLAQLSLNTLDELSKITATYRAKTGDYAPMADNTINSLFGEFDSVKAHYQCYFEERFDLRCLKQISLILLFIWIIAFVWAAFRLVKGPIDGFVAIEIGFCAGTATFNFLAYMLMWVGNTQRSSVERSVRYNIDKLAGMAAVVIRDHIEYLALIEKDGSELAPTVKTTRSRQSSNGANKR